MCGRHLMPACNAADWSKASCAFGATPATPSICPRRGFCPSCGARRMADGAAWLVDRVLPERPIRQAGYAQQSARTGAVTLIQRFGSALNLNIHFHMLFLDGVYEVAPDGTRLRFQNGCAHRHRPS